MTLEELEKKLFELDDLRMELNKLDDLRMELNKHIAELKARDEEKPKPPHPRWKPEEGENYYYISDAGGVDIDRWDFDDIDEFRFNTGIVFMTEEAVKFAAERLKVLAEMREWAGKWNDGILLTYFSDNNSIEITMGATDYTNGEMRFATPKDAHNCVKAVGADRIKKYYFMIPEDTE